MLSRVVGKRILSRQTMQLSKMVKPGNHVCFCGCVDGKHFNNNSSRLVDLAKRNFQGHLGLDSTANLVPVEYKPTD